jgi:DNA-binding NarL/FixJ family response regulator
MLRTIALSVDTNDGACDLGAAEWRSIALEALARSGEALVVCDSDLRIRYCSSRAILLLKRLSVEPLVRVPGRCGHAEVLPEVLAAVVRAQVDSGADGQTARVRPLPGGNTIEVQTSTLRADGRASVCVYLREELLRDDALYGTLRERFSVSMRGFQLALLIRKGLTNRQIAERLNLAESTVKVYLYQLYRACGVSSRTGLVALLDRLP